MTEIRPICDNTVTKTHLLKLLLLTRHEKKLVLMSLESQYISFFEELQMSTKLVTMDFILQRSGELLVI